MPETKRERAVQSFAAFLSSPLDELLAPAGQADIEQHALALFRLGSNTAARR